MQHYVVIDLGGTLVKYALADETGNLTQQGKTPSTCSNAEELLDLLERVARQFTVPYQGVAISMPGRIETRTGVAHTGGTFSFLHHTPIAPLLQQRLGVPVTIANDGKCAANAELWQGSMRDVENGVVIVLGTGTGGGLILNHQVYMGHTLGAGEFSFLAVDYQLLPKGIADSRDDLTPVWAHYMSAKGLLRIYRVHKHLAPDTPLDGFSFFRAYDAGEPEARAALEEFGRYAAAGIYTIQSVLDSQRIAIGGGISARPEIVQEIARAVDRQYAAISFTAFGKPEIVRCQFGNDANLIGALAFHLAAAAPQH